MTTTWFDDLDDYLASPRVSGLAVSADGSRVVTIVAELNEAQGKAVDIGGYYAPDSEITAAVMRPSKTFNAALAAAQG